MKKQKLSTGEVARICNINKKTLFYYDQIDLFKPAGIESNGYRYYTYDQLDLLSKIKALQSVGFSLLEIKQQLSVEDLSKGIDTLHQQKGKIEQKMNELVKVERNLSQKIIELEHYNEIGDDNVFLEEYEEEYLFVERTIQQEGVMTNFLLDGYHFGMMLNVPSDSSEEMQMNKFKKVDHDTEGNYKKEKGAYVGVYFVTEHHNILQNSIKAISLIEDSGHRFSGPIYLRDIATDFVTHNKERIPFLITAKLDGGRPTSR